MPVRIAYLEEFKGAHTLLIDGEAHDLSRLAVAFEGLALPGAEPIEIQSLPFVGTSPALRAALASEGLGVSRSGQTFTWLHAGSEWATFAQQISTLVRSGQRTPVP